MQKKFTPFEELLIASIAVLVLGAIIVILFPETFGAVSTFIIISPIPPVP